MITGSMKDRIDSMWDMIAAGGIVNPLDVIEQITYLLFIRDLEKRAELIADLHMRWSELRKLPDETLFDSVRDRVFPWLRSLRANGTEAGYLYMEDAVFKIPSPQLLRRVMNALDEICALAGPQDRSDMRGDVYEYLLSKLAQSGRNGQFRTPRHIIRMMVEMMAPAPEDIICDPACGTSGFLVAAAEFLQESGAKADGSRIFGYDIDRTMLRIGAMNMMTHGVSAPAIGYCNSLSAQNADAEKFSLILANPPFKGSLEGGDVDSGLLDVCRTKKTELLFLALFLRMLKPGGRCACIVPEGVLFGTSKAHRDMRRAIVSEHCLEAVISLPAGVFRPYASVRTAILIFTKTGCGGTENVWFCEVRADGYSQDDRRLPVEENDIPDTIARFRNRADEMTRSRTCRSFMVPAAEIAQNGYDFTIARYSRTETPVAKRASSQEILAELRQLDAQIREGYDELEKLMKQR